MRASILAAMISTGVLPIAGMAGITAGRLGSTEPHVPEDIASAPNPPTGARPLAVVLAGNAGTEITDALGPVSVLGESGIWQIRVVAPERKLSTFTSAIRSDSGLDFMPDLSFAEYEERVGRAPDLVVIPYLPFAKDRDRAAVDWLRAHVGPKTHVLSVCAGAEVAAMAGVLDGRTATTHHAYIDGFAKRFPDVRWAPERRWVADGPVVSTEGIAAGIDGALALVDRTAGRGCALEVARALHYPNTRFLDDATSIAWTADWIGIFDASSKTRSTIDVLVEDGDQEIDVAAAVDLQAMTFERRVRTIGARRVHPSLHGIRLVPRVESSDRAVSARNESGEFAFDAVLRDLANESGGRIARSAANNYVYPTPLELDGWTMGLFGRPLGAMAMIGAFWTLVFYRRRVTR